MVFIGISSSISIPSKISLKVNFKSIRPFHRIAWKCPNRDSLVNANCSLNWWTLDTPEIYSPSSFGPSFSNWYDPQVLSWIPDRSPPSFDLLHWAGKLFLVWEDQKVPLKNQTKAKIDILFTWLITNKGNHGKVRFFKDNFLPEEDSWDEFSPQGKKGRPTRQINKVFHRSFYLSLF